jgi:hypothetical protein
MTRKKKYKRRPGGKPWFWAEVMKLIKKPTPGKYRRLGGTSLRIGRN